MSEIPLGRIESEYGFNRYATAVSGAVQRTVRYHSSDIVRGYFDLVEEVRELLKIPATIFRVGDSDLKIIWLSGSPRMFPKIFRVERWRAKSQHQKDPAVGKPLHLRSVHGSQ